jgi:ParB/RepB/Spo0J family partition protein
MAKRRRLTPANPAYLEPRPPQPEVQSPPALRAPIAEVASDASARAAMQDMADEMAQARKSGRMIARLDLSQIDQSYLVRDRVVIEDEEMRTLVTSILERGQQTPIEVTPLGKGRYGLISGWRRCQAIARLQATKQGDGTVLALERHPENASDAYRSMVEENEIRAGLSYFERARIVDVAVEQGVFESHKKALRSLFSAASRAKRSKIGSFVIVVQVLGDRLFFPAAIGERMGLRLARLIDLYPDKAEDLAAKCLLNRFETSEEELAFLNKWALAAEQQEKSARAPRPTPAHVDSHPRPGLRARFHADDKRLELSGAALTAELHAEIMAFLKAGSENE